MQNLNAQGCQGSVPQSVKTADKSFPFFIKIQGYFLICPLEGTMPEDE